jgi:hypothetical protein
MGASVSKANECECCTKVHAAVAALAYRDAGKVSTALADLETAVIEEPLRATLRMRRKLTREHSVDADDMRAVLAAGVSREQIDDALAVSFTFNAVDRLSRAFGFFVQSSAAVEAGAKLARARLPLKALLSALAPKPDSQGRQHDEGQHADPERDADIARPHVHTEEDSEQLGDGNQPEEDRHDKRCWPVVHSNSSARIISSEACEPSASERRRVIFSIVASERSNP